MKFTEILTICAKHRAMAVVVVDYPAQKTDILGPHFAVTYSDDLRAYHIFPLEEIDESLSPGDDIEFAGLSAKVFETFADAHEWVREDHGLRQTKGRPN